MEPTTLEAVEPAIPPGFEECRNGRMEPTTLEEE